MDEDGEQNYDVRLGKWAATFFLEDLANAGHSVSFEDAFTTDYCWNGF